jgi:hypothetical protein
VYVSEYSVHCKKAQVSWHRRMNRRSNSYLRRMIERSKAAKSEASDELTVHLRALSVYPMTKFEQDRDVSRLD